ncbi:Myb-like DNA-binding domain-containing, putative [Babesia ovis]|uniref:Myb-like DNA-binding domain-containing, putative n=1 Tax=Babesia ovis TaxID=5869 RepID=A0A9W5TCX8_BABOV|nr:Myb-like DNA-binding domain-containing, putative [Babesia ovis]
MEGREKMQLTPSAIERMSPSISLLRQMAGINQRAHEVFMARLSKRLSDRESGSPAPLGYSKKPYGGQAVYQSNQGTIMAQSPKGTPKARLTTEEMVTPKNVRNRKGQADVETTKTPTAHPGSRSLLNKCMSACSSLRFNPESLVSMPFGYCNNTFVKIKADDVFDPRVGRKRTRYDHGHGDTATAQVSAATRRATKQAAQALELEQLRLHNEYAMNPYKRRYQFGIRERRRLETVTLDSGYDGTQLPSPKKPRAHQQPKQAKKREVYTDYNKELLLADENETRERSKLINAPAENIVKVHAPLPLDEDQRSNIANLAIISNSVKTRLLGRMMDVVKIATILKQVAQGNSGVVTGVENICQDPAKLAEMSQIVRSLITEMEHEIIGLQYTKLLLNWNVTPPSSAVENGENIEHQQDLGGTDKATEGKIGFTGSTTVNLYQNNDVLAASPCITFSDGLTCAQGRCSTSKQSYNAGTLTGCYTAAGCYLWEPTYRNEPPEKIGGYQKNEAHSGESKPFDLKNYMDKILKVPHELQAQFGSEDGILEDADDDLCLGKTGPWTNDPVFAKEILDANRKTRFSALAGYLKDICRIAMAEVRIPRPDWRGPNEVACNNEMCCPRCCVCKSGTSDGEKTMKGIEIILEEDNEAVRFEQETTMAKTELLALHLGKCVCCCKCVSEQMPLERVVNDNTTRSDAFNEGIVWHNIEPSEHVLEADLPNLPNESIIQERFTLRVKSESVPPSWKRRSPFICKLNIITDDDETGAHGNKCDTSADVEHMENDIGSTETSSSCDKVHNGHIFGRRKRTPLLQIKGFKELSSFTFWDAVDMIAKEQQELHSVLNKDDENQCFDPLEIDTSRMPQETLKLSSDSIVENAASGDYVEIALYLPYAPTCTLPWRFESLDIVEKLTNRFRVRQQVGVKRHTDLVGVAVDTTTEKSESESFLQDRSAPDGFTLSQTHTNNCNSTPTTSRVFDETYSNHSALPSEIESYTTANMEDDGMTTDIGGNTPINRNTNSLDDDITNKESDICSQLLRDVVVLPSSVKRVQQILRQHIRMRNEVLKIEADACKAYRYKWHKNLKRMRSGLPKVDPFAWGVLPVRALDTPHHFVPLPAGYKQNDMGWPYKTNNSLSPFDVEGYGIGDIRNKRQRFSALAQNAQTNKRRDDIETTQMHTTRKPNLGRRRGAAEPESVDHDDVDHNQATAWMAPSYSNLTGPGIRWAYSCMDTMDEPLKFIPDFKAMPIYKIMKSPEYNYYSLDHCLQYDRKNSLRPEVVMADEITGRISNVWTRNECRIFVEKYLMYPKNFAKIAQFIETKRCGDCVTFYYRFKYRLKLKERLEDMKSKPKYKYEMSRFLKRDMHVMQALDNLVDDCYTDCIKQVCEQNAITLAAVSDSTLSVGGIDTDKPYEVALTEHRGNWSPLEDNGNITLDNLQEGYFIPTKYRCLITRKNMELPLNTVVGNEETTTKRGCLVLNGSRNFGDERQTNALISAIKTEHFMSLKPVHSRRVVGRSVLESVMQSMPLEWQQLPPDTSLGIVNNVAPEEPTSVAVEIPDVVDDGNEGSECTRNVDPHNGWGRPVTMDDLRVDNGTLEDLMSIPLPSPYELEREQMQVSGSFSSNHFSAKRDPFASFSDSSNIGADENRLHNSPEMYPSGSEHAIYRSLQKQRVHIRNPALDVGPSVQTQRKAKKTKQSMRAHSGNRETGKSKYNAKLQQPITSWSDEEVAQFVRLYRIYGEDWDILERQMAVYGKTREQIINYYITRLTNNAIKKGQQEYPTLGDDAEIQVQTEPGDGDCLSIGSLDGDSFSVTSGDGVCLSTGSLDGDSFSVTSGDGDCLSIGSLDGDCFSVTSGAGGFSETGSAAGCSTTLGCSAAVGSGVSAASLAITLPLATPATAATPRTHLATLRNPLLRPDVLFIFRLGKQTGG